MGKVFLSGSGDAPLDGETIVAIVREKNGELVPIIAEFHAHDAVFVAVDEHDGQQFKWPEEVYSWSLPRS
ncbi:hypothetical protein [Tahibacter amnicola]|uniref:Uncharacterized protein n=1 Tax=Tahibacter amnicola TaxID=2976241 RepID=A0ABY6BGV1_9GAMM|nr:hypothetical protein [Tahibacter amnicola]UXI67600.1 hypothetical protein N4264_23140 [Tahibacter amnicola]